MNNIIVALVTVLVLFSSTPNLDRPYFDANMKGSITTLKESSNIDSVTILEKSNNLGITSEEETNLEINENTEKEVSGVEESYVEVNNNLEKDVSEILENNKEEKKLENEEASTGAINESTSDVEVIDVPNTMEQVIFIDITDSEVEVEPPEEEYTYTKLDKIMYVTSSLNVRSGPSTDFDVVDHLKFADEVKVIGQCNENNWYKIKIEGKEYYVSDKYLSDEIVFFDGICQADGSVNPIYLSNVNAELSKLPSWVLDAFVSSEWNIYLTDKDINKEFCGGRYGPCLGLTIYGAREIYIENREKATYSAPIHEMGHFLDCYSGWISSTPEYLEIFNAEEATLREAFNIKIYWDTKEFFAESLYLYYTQNEKLEKSAPGICAYIKNLLNG